MEEHDVDECIDKRIISVYDEETGRWKKVILEHCEICDTILKIGANIEVEPDLSEVPF